MTSKNKTPSDEPPKPRGASLGSPSAYSWVRRAHYFTALPLAALLIFLVVTGILSLQDKLRPRGIAPKQITTSCSIPETVPMTTEGVGVYLNTLFPGTLDSEFTEDTDETIHISISSVWRHHDLVVNKASRECRVTIEEYPTAQALVDIHSAKKASKAQLLLFQVLGVVLLLMIISGIALAVLRRPKKKVLLAMGLLLVGCMLLAVLAANR